MTGMGLTPRQAEVLAVIVRWFGEYGIGPTIREIMGATGTGSSSSVHAVLCSLERRGHITRKQGRHRGIEFQPRTQRYRFIPVSDLTWPVAA